MKNILFLLIGLVFFQQLHAHEFWLSPQKFSYQAGEKVFLRWRVGENFEGANWTGNNEKCNALRAISNNYQYDLLGYLSANKGDSVKLDTINYAGNYTMFYYGKNSLMEMDAAAFNTYLEEDGLTNALQWRKENHMDTAKGREYYQRCAKALIRIKSTLKKSDYMKTSFFGGSMGMPLEIVPTDNPYNIKTTTNMLFNVFYLSRPLRDGTVKLWHKVNGKTDVKTVPVTKGVIAVDIEPVGEYMISLVKMEPSKVDNKADWQSYWGSLTWGY